MSKERYVNLSDRQVKDTQNQSQDFMSINTICRRLNQQDKTIADLETKLELHEQSNKVLNDQLNKATGHISELNEKLAESEHRNEQLVDALNGEVFINYKVPMENAQLKQQLAEKENTITTLIEDSKASKEFLKKELAEKNEEIAYLTKQVKKFNNEAQKYYEDAYCNDTIYQDKISFAVEQLKKVKEEIGNKIDTFIDYYGDRCIETGDLEFFIDNQIKQLKEWK